MRLARFATAGIVDLDHPIGAVVGKVHLPVSHISTDIARAVASGLFM